MALQHSLLCIVLCGAMLLGARVAGADSRISTDHPDGTVLITRGLPQDVEVVLTFADAARLRPLISKIFDRPAGQHPRVQKFDISTIGTLVTQRKFALLLSAQDSAHALIDPLFDEPGLSFWLLEDRVSLRPISLKLSDGRIVGEGTLLTDNATSQPILLANEIIEERLDALLHPQQTPRVAVQSFVERLELEVDTIAPLTSETLIQHVTKNFAMLLDTGTLAQPIGVSLMNVVSDPHLYWAKPIINLRNITPAPRSTQRRATPTSPSQPLAKSNAASPMLTAVAIETLETGLARAGTFLDAPDGLISDGTINALRQWARPRGIEVPPEITTATIAEIFELISVPDNRDEPVDFILLRGVNIGGTVLRSHYSDPTLENLNITSCTAACAAEAQCNVASFYHGCELLPGVGYRNDWGGTGFKGDPIGISSAKDTFSAIRLSRQAKKNTNDQDILAQVRNGFVPIAGRPPVQATLETLLLPAASISIDLAPFVVMRKSAATQNELRGNEMLPLLRATGTPPIYGDQNWIVVSPLHRDALIVWERAIVDQAEATEVLSSFEAALGDAKNRYGPRHPAAAPIHVDLARFWYSVGAEPLESNFDTRRGKRLDHLRQAETLLRDTIATGEKSRLEAWHAMANIAQVHSIAALSWSFDEITQDAQGTPVTQQGRCFADAPQNRARSDQILRMVLQDFELHGLRPEQLGQMKAASVCLDDPTRQLAILGARLELAQLDLAGSFIPLALADLAVAAYNAGDKPKSREHLRHTIGAYSQLPAEARLWFWESHVHSNHDLTDVINAPDRIYSPIEALAKLGPSAERDFMIATLAGGLKQGTYADTYTNERLLHLITLLVQSENTALVRAVLRDLYVQFDLGQTPSEMEALNFIYDQSKDFDIQRGLSWLEFAEQFEPFATPTARLARYSRLVENHTQSNQLAQAAQALEAGLVLMAQEPETLQTQDAAYLREVAGVARREQGDVTLAADQMARSLKEEITTVCGLNGERALFPWLPLDRLSDDPLLAAQFLEDPVINDFLKCFNRFKLWMAEKRERSGVLPVGRLQDVMYVLAMRNDRDGAEDLFNHVLRLKTWTTSDQPEHARYHAVAAALHGLILGNKGHWITQNPALKLPYIPNDLRVWDQTRESLTLLGYAYDAIGLPLAALDVYRAFERTPRCSKPDQICEFAAAFEAKILGQTPDLARANTLMTSTLSLSQSPTAEIPDPALKRRDTVILLRQHLAAERHFAADLYARALYGMEVESADALLADETFLTPEKRVNLAAVVAVSRLAEGRLQEARAITTPIVAKARTTSAGFALYGDDPLVRRSAELRPVLEAHLNTATFPQRILLSDIQQSAENDFFAAQMLQATNTAASFAKLSARVSNAEADTMRALQDVSVRLSSALEGVVRGEPSAQVIALQAERDALLDGLAPTMARQAGLRLPGLTETAALLREDEAFLFTYVGEAVTYLWLIKSQVVEVHRIDLRETQIRALVSRVRQVVDPDRIEDPLNLMPLYEAHELLLEPFTDALASVGTLILVPHGPLDSLPWAVLLTEPPTVDRMRPEALREAALPWLLRRYQLAQVPSLAAASFLRSNAFEASPNHRQFFGVGRPDFGTGLDVTGTETRRGADAFAVAPLPDTGAEIMAMSNLLGADLSRDVLLDGAATEARVRAAELHRYEVLSFATHGVLSGELPGLAEPALLLAAPQNGGDPANDGVLRASEVLELSLNARLVILSACNTAASAGTPGAEGLSGLANAFIYAGARSLIVTHWQVPSGAALRVSVGSGILYRQSPLNEQDWSGSLRASMLELMDKTGNPTNAHPVNWGAFIFVGMPEKTNF